MPTSLSHKSRRTRSHRASDSTSSSENVVDRCSKLVIDAALMSSVFVVPFLLGGRIAWGQFALSACAIVAALAWSVGLLFGKRPTWTVTWVEPLLLGAIGVGLLQVTPLPPSLLGVLSPHHYALLPLWSGATDAASSLGEWRTLSLNVGETQAAIVVSFSYVLLFYVATQRIQRVRDVEQMLRWVAGASAMMAIFGLTQWVTNNGKFGWFYEYPLTDTWHRLKGAFTNRNHFAQFLVLGCGPLLWWIARLLEERQAGSGTFGSSSKTASVNNSDTVFAGLLVAFGVLLFAAMFSLSRGGMLAMGVSLVVMLGALFRIGVLSGRVMISMLGITLIAGSLFAWFGYEKVTKRLDNWESDSRLAIWQANLQVFGDFPLFGTGLGSHAEAYPLYYDPPFAEAEFTHAENSYLQIASESGAVGIGLLLLSGLCVATWCIRSQRENVDRRIRVLSAAITASLAANAVHAAFDFVWYVPGLMTVILLLVACVRRLDQLALAEASNQNRPALAEESNELATQPSPAIPRMLGLLSGAGICGIALWMVPQLNQTIGAEPYWFTYLRLIHANNSEEQGTSASPHDDEEDQTEQAQIERFKRRVAALSQAAKHNPANARTHLRLASAYLTAFEHLQKSSENPMSLAQLRDTALTAQFKSVDEMRAWLDRAVGPNLKYLDAAAKHATKSLQICPLQGQGYVHLAELQFLRDLDPSHPKDFLKQAHLVRPFSAQVQFVVGREALIEGKLEEALVAWKEAFHTSRAYQDQILDQLVGTAPADLVLKSLEPNVDELERLEIRYREQPESEHFVVVRALATALKEDADKPECARPIERILAAAVAFTRLNELTEADLCFRKAIEKDRSSLAARRGYGVFLYHQQQFARAAEHLQWCARMNPTDGSLRKLAEDATNRSLRYESPILPAEFRALGTKSKRPTNR